MMPFLTSLLTPHYEALINKAMSFPLAKQNKLPQLRAWVKVVFGAYLLLTVPILLYVFARMIFSMPDLVTQAESGVRLQLELLRTIELRREPGTTVLVLLQMILLVAPVPATL